MKQTHFIITALMLFVGFSLGQEPIDEETLIYDGEEEAVVDCDELIYDAEAEYRARNYEEAVNLRVMVAQHKDCDEGLRAKNQYLAGDIYQNKLNNIDEAIKAYQKVIDDYAGSKYVARAKRKLTAAEAKRLEEETIVEEEAVASAQVSVVVSVDKKKINQSQYITFEIRAEGSDGFPQVDLSVIKDFAIAGGPSQSSSYQMYNNKVTTAFTLSWNLRPKKNGKLLIPSLKVKVDGKNYITKPISIQVSKSPKSRSQRKQQPESETEYIFLKSSTDKREAYIGEQITVEFLLYTQVSINDLSISQKPQGIGFWKEELQSPRSPKFRLREQEGVRYNVASLGKIALFPTETGQLTLDPMVVNATVSSRSINRMPTFDDFRFGDPFSIFPQTERIRLESEPIELTIHPLPLDGRPVNYSQAVGQFSLSTYIDSSEVEVNKAVTFKVELKGSGNLNLIEISEPDFPVGVDIFDRKRPLFDRDVFRDDFTGVKRWEYIIMPRRSGLFIVPEMELVPGRLPDPNRCG